MVFCSCFPVLTTFAINILAQLVFWTRPTVECSTVSCSLLGAVTASPGFHKKRCTNRFSRLAEMCRVAPPVFTVTDLKVGLDLTLD